MASVLVSKTYRIYVDYDHDKQPPHPGHGWTRFVCISDTHSLTFRLPAGDVLLHAGDLSSWGRTEQISRTVEWLKSQDHPTKIIIAGNHDLSLDKKLFQTFPGVLGREPNDRPEVAQLIVRGRTTRDAGICYLEYESVVFRTSSGKEWKIYGSPAAPVYAHGSFQYGTPEEADAIYAQIPEDTDILVTHTPPYGILDLSKKGKHAGCKRLARRLRDLKQCRLHVFGHIHEARGAQVIDDGGERVAVNAAMPLCGRAIIIDLEN